MSKTKRFITFSITLAMASGCSLYAKLRPGSGGGSSDSGDSSGSSDSSDSSDDEPGPAAVSADGAPTWCKGYESADDKKARWIEGYIKSEGFSTRVLSYMAMGACDNPSDGARRDEVREWQAAYQAQFGGTSRHFADAMALYIDKDRLEKQKAEQCERFATTVESAPKARSIGASMRAAFDCSRESVDDSLMWWIDGPEIGELERAVFVDQCIARDVDVRDVARCGHDLGAMNNKRLAKQLKKGDFNHYGRVTAQQIFGNTKRRADKTLAEVAKQAKTSGAWKQMLVDGPPAAHAAWMEIYKANQPVFEAVAAFEAKADAEEDTAGCEKTLGKLVREKIAASRTKTAELKEAARGIVDEVGYPLLAAQMHCAVLGGRLLEAYVMYQIISVGGRGPFRGPRVAAYWAFIENLNDARGKSKRFSMKDPPQLPRTGGALLGGLYGETFNKVRSESAKGLIKKLSKRGDELEVTFKKVSFKEPTYKCRKTNRIARIDSDGVLVYEEKCKQTGTRTIVTEVKPVTIARDYARDLKKGQFIEVAVDSKNGRRGIPLGIYKDKKQERLLGILGTTW